MKKRISFLRVIENISGILFLCVLISSFVCLLYKGVSYCASEPPIKQTIVAWAAGKWWTALPIFLLYIAFKRERKRKQRHGVFMMIMKKADLEAVAYHKKKIRQNLLIVLGGLVTMTIALIGMGSVGSSTHVDHLSLLAVGSIPIIGLFTLFALYHRLLIANLVNETDRASR